MYLINCRILIYYVLIFQELLCCRIVYRVSCHVDVPIHQCFLGYVSLALWLRPKGK